jgi:hypothetical protein
MDSVIPSTCTYACIHKYTHIYAYTKRSKYVYVRMHTYIHTRLYNSTFKKPVYTCMHTHIYAYTPARTRPFSGTFAPLPKSSRTSSLDKTARRSLRAPPQPRPSSVMCKPALRPASRSSQSSCVCIICVCVCMYVFWFQCSCACRLCV